MNPIIAPEPTTEALYQHTIPGARASDAIEFVDHEAENDVFLAGIVEPTLTAYLPSDQEGTGTAVIICPGGGYFGLSMIKEGHDVAKRFQALGIAAFVLKYRMPNRDTMVDTSVGPLQDAQHALALVRARSKQYSVDPARIGIMGFSAGAHLASSVATHYHQPVNSAFLVDQVRPDFQVLIYPVISMQPGVVHVGSKQNLLGDAPSGELVNAFSSELQVRRDSPLAFILHANDDDVVAVENALCYHRALIENEVATQLLLLPDGGHGFGMRHGIDWFQSLMQWMSYNGFLTD